MSATTGKRTMDPVTWSAAGTMSNEDIVERLERQYARTGLKYMLEAANEIDRLRGLLHDALKIDAGDFSVNVDEWTARVREALGA